MQNDFPPFSELMDGKTHEMQKLKEKFREYLVSEHLVSEHCVESYVFLNDSLVQLLLSKNDISPDQKEVLLKHVRERYLESGCKYEINISEISRTQLKNGNIEHCVKCVTNDLNLGKYKDFKIMLRQEKNHSIDRSKSLQDEFSHVPQEVFARRATLSDIFNDVRNKLTVRKSSKPIFTGTKMLEDFKF